MKNVFGGGTVSPPPGDTHSCHDGPCNLYIRSTGETLQGTCFNGTTICVCVAGGYSTDPHSTSVCAN